jgi:hypothetical protein
LKSFTNQIITIFSATICFHYSQFSVLRSFSCWTECDESNKREKRCNTKKEACFSLFLIDDM